MEFGKLFTVNIEFKELQSQRSDKTLTLDVVLIARTHQFLQTLLYELKHEALMGIALGSYHEFATNIFPNECTLIGEVLSLNRKKKQVLLSNRILVSYQYLILLTREDQKLSYMEEEFASAFQALVSALRVQAQKASILPNNQQGGESSKVIQNPTYYADKEELPEGVIKMPYPKNHPENTSGMRSNKCLYELDLSS